MLRNYLALRGLSIDEDELGKRNVYGRFRRPVVSLCRGEAFHEAQYRSNSRFTLRQPTEARGARCPNRRGGAAKFCGAPVMSEEPYPFKHVWPFLHQIIDAFRPERLMWGSDFTRMRWVPVEGGLAPRDQWKLTAIVSTTCATQAKSPRRTWCSYCQAQSAECSAGRKRPNQMGQTASRGLEGANRIETQRPTHPHNAPAAPTPALPRESLDY